MTTTNLLESASQKALRAKILFSVFVIVFSLTAVFAFIALTVVFIYPERAESYPQFCRLVWALWSTVIAEVATAIFAISKDVFDLKSEPEIITARNIIRELIDGLESCDDISEEKAAVLRKEYAGVIGAGPSSSVLAKPVLQKIAFGSR